MIVKISELIFMKCLVLYLADYKHWINGYDGGMAVLIAKGLLHILSWTTDHIRRHSLGETVSGSFLTLFLPHYKPVLRCYLFSTSLGSECLPTRQGPDLSTLYISPGSQVLTKCLILSKGLLIKSISELT